MLAAELVHLDMQKYGPKHVYHLNHKNPLALHRYSLVAAAMNREGATVEALLQHLNLDLNATIGRFNGTKFMPLLAAVDARSIELSR